MSEAPTQTAQESLRPGTGARILKVVLPIVVLVLGIGGVRMLVATKPATTRTERTSAGLLVEVVQVEGGSHAVGVRAQGQVIPAKRVVLSPEVPGRVRRISDELVPGGRFREGDLVFQVDSREYSLAVQSRAAEVNRAELELQLEERRGEVASREWQAFGGESGSEAGEALALRQPQRETAEVSVTAARNAVQTARLNLSRTRTRAPFNSTVVNENVDVGQYVAPGSQLATLVGTDAAWVQVSVPLSSLSRITLPRGDDAGARAAVRHEVDGETITREGRVVRLLPDLDPAGSMARVLVEVRDPLRIDEQSEDPPLLFGTYASVEIDGGELEGVEIPRRAVREGDQVYVMSADSTLSVREVRVAWSLEETVLVSDGVEAGERVIVSRVSGAIDGLPLRTAGASE